MAYHQNGGGPLEERLRSLIINNSGPPANSPSQDISPTGDAFANGNGHENDNQPSQPDVAGQLNASKTQPRKRLNQAQRRQMSAQLSIPIDPRPQQPLHSARSHGSSPGHPHQQHYGGGRGGGRGGGYYRGDQGPHSATFRPPSQGINDNAFPNAPLTGGAHFGQRGGRHQTSQSYHGPMPTHDSLEWRQPHMQHSGPNVQHQGRQMRFDPSSPRHATRHSGHVLYNPGRQHQVSPEDLKVQTDLLDGLCHTIILNAEIEPADIIEKENFRAMIEQVTRSAITQYEVTQHHIPYFPPESVQLRCFGSLSSGFATKAADMDLGLLSPLSPIQPDAPGSPIPRLVEKALLDIGLGARLLSRTRVPIIKVCARPPEKLRLDLLDERAKWEAGITEEHEEAHDDVEPSPSAEHLQSAEGNLSVGERLKSLKQGDKNLPNYYGSAKSLLRKLGGRDLSNSNMSDFQAEDYLLLNEVCLAFVDGLADPKLRDTLLQYKSLNREDLLSGKLERTLMGVFTQIEGETAALLFDNRVLREKDEFHEQQAWKWINNWRLIQETPNVARDPLVYQKELYTAADQLKKIASIQILSLSQLSHESAAQYQSRATRLLENLVGNDTSPRADNARSIVVQQYIKGMRADDLRQQVQAFAASCENPTLQMVARRHKSLQLAQDYTKCLEKGMYTEQAAAAVSRYVELLKAPMSKTSLTNGRNDTVVALTEDAAALMSEISMLGDPAKLPPNQPRDPYRDRLEFPKFGVGVQCDINFSAHLGLQNTLLLRCYSHTDPRVRPLVLFVKHWAKVRGINSPYRGTLSSYGYVLMMLHYLVNVVQPFVCPNLQELAPPPNPNLTPQQVEETVCLKGRNIQFWRDEAAIQALARDNALNQNRDSIGHLLRGFFEYYAQSNQMSLLPGRGFDWGRDVLSLRTHGGLLSKQEKGWTGAKTVMEEVKSEPTAVPPVPGVNSDAALPQQQQQQQQGTPAPESTPAPAREFKEVRYRYLFAIEDPFELEHNVARTVTHNGIVSIRDEFRRAWRIIRTAGKAGVPEDLLEDVAVAESKREKEAFAKLLEELHGSA
ncbi:Poly(A) RNA polymerase protein cid1 [Podospora australis]|uniref:polynucleotide adenylyltransferase n=1 Tax=Podospora australis TaxID=1536484 RepID=A0AAN6X4H1_9PEZI|nr:Poly(A) RNA polymerase protein cid1 [Podospora australis]